MQFHFPMQCYIHHEVDHFERLNILYRIVIMQIRGNMSDK